MPRISNITSSPHVVYPMFLITTSPVQPGGYNTFSDLVGMHVSASVSSLNAYDIDFEATSSILLVSTQQDEDNFRVQLSVDQPKKFRKTYSVNDDVKSALYMSPNFHLDPFLVENYESDQRKNRGTKLHRPENLHHYVMATNEEDLHQAIWNKLQQYGSPLLPEWKDTLIELLYEANMIRDLHVQYFNYQTDNPAQAVALTASEHGLERIITDAIQSYRLPFALDTMGSVSAFNDIKTLPDYINHFAPDLAKAVQANIEVMYDPSRGDVFPKHFEELNGHANRQGLTGMFAPQAAAVMSISKTIEAHDFAFVCGEMGVGKTVISASAPYIHARGKGHEGYRAIVLSPNIMLYKWKREIEERVPNADVQIIKTFEDLTKLDRKAKRPDRPTYFILSQTAFKTNYPKEPIRLRRLGYEDAPVPRGERAEYSRNEKKEGRPVLKMHHAEHTWDKTHFFCSSCGLSIGENPFGKSLTKPSKASMKDSCQSCRQPFWGAARLAPKSKNRKVSPAWYINKFFPRGYFEYLLVDEAHEYKSGNTDIGKALGQLINHTTYQLLMTGTLFGGKAIDLFYLVARLKPSKLGQEAMSYHSKSTFHANYGVTQSREVTNLITERSDRRRVERPGISPSLYPMYLMANAVFLDLSDLGYALPPYEEVPELVRLDERLNFTYHAALQTVQEFHGRMSNDEQFKQNHPTYTAATLVHQLNAMLDRPYARGKISLFSNTGQETVVYDADHIERDYRPAKYQRLLQLVREERDQGRKVLIYAKDVDADNPDRGLDLWLKERLEEDGLSAGLLRASGKDHNGQAYPAGTDREKWLKKNSKENDWDVLIVNPTLVKVGLDMLEYKTIIFYQFGLSAFEYMQASRRSWRIRQDKNIRVITLAYQYTPQQYYLELLATKIDAALTIQGKMSDEGMRSMAESSGDLNELAKNIMNGDQLADVETVHDKFRNLNQTYEQLTRSDMMTYDTYTQNPDLETLEAVLRGDVIEVAKDPEPQIELLPDPIVFTPEQSREAAAHPVRPIPKATIPRKRRSDMDVFQDLIKVEQVAPRKKDNTVTVDQFVLDF